MAEWRAAAAAALAAGPTALVTILATEGSAPRGPGARMVVTADALRGTIGGGALEHQAAEQARLILAHPPGSWRIQDYPLGPLLGQCCGGRVRLMVEHLSSIPNGEGTYAVSLGDTVIRAPVPSTASNGPILEPNARQSLAARGPLPTSGATFIEPIEATSLTLLLFGAGHVGRAIATHTAALPIHLAWFDTRAAEAETPGVMRATEAEMIACAREAPKDGAIVIVTHDHALDYQLTAAALQSPAQFTGLIGSATKRARFLSRLAAENIDATRLTCPIGVPGIVGKEPEVIAIATLAQLLMLRPAA